MEHTFRHLLFGHESTYLVAVLLFDQDTACHEHKSLSDAKCRTIFQERLQKIHHLLPQPNNCSLVSKQSCSLGIREGAFTHYPEISDICAGQICWPEGSHSPSLLNIFMYFTFFSFFLNVRLKLQGLYGKLDMKTTLYRANSRAFTSLFLSHMSVL